VTRAVLWDLDGTLVDSGADIASAIARMLRRTGRAPLPEATIRGFVGEGARRLVDRCVRAAGGDPSGEDLAIFLDEYRGRLVERTVVYPGVPALLARVRAPMAVVTNKPEDLACGILAALGLAHHFPVVIGGDTLPVRKPDPEPLREALRRLGATEGVMVGDGAPDVGAARAAGMPMIGVGWGISTPVGPDVQAEDVAALEGALRGLGVPLG
jgi:phosphoglycolate phosphatase